MVNARIKVTINGILNRAIILEIDELSAKGSFDGIVGPGVNFFLEE